MYLLDANPANAILVEYIRRNLWLMQIFLVVHFQRKLTSAIIFVGMHFDSFSVSGVWGPIYRVLCLSLWMIVLFIIITEKNNLFLKNLNNTRGHNCIYSLASEQVFFSWARRHCKLIFTEFCLKYELSALWIGYFSHKIVVNYYFHDDWADRALTERGLFLFHSDCTKDAENGLWWEQGDFIARKLHYWPF